MISSRLWCLAGQQGCAAQEVDDLGVAVASHTRCCHDKDVAFVSQTMKTTKKDDETPRVGGTVRSWHSMGFLLSLISESVFCVSDESLVFDHD